MDKAFWIKRFCTAFIGAGLLLLAVQLMKGHDLVHALRYAGGWGAVTAALFTLIGYARYKRNPACMLPRERRG